MTNEEKINLIGQKIILLSQNIERNQNDLAFLKSQLEQLQYEMHLSKFPSNFKPEDKKEENKIEPPIQNPIQNPIIEPVKEPVIEPVNEIVPPVQQPILNPINVNKIEPLKTPQTFVSPNAKQNNTSNSTQASKSKFNLEEYIGGKLLSIIGMFFLVIGIAVGVKYAIDEGYINELTRVILSYAAGGVLLTFAFYLRSKYKVFSAVLLGGGSTVLYFTTFFAHYSYHLFPGDSSLMPFAIMVIITAFTVFAAHIYNFEVIALIGLIGAYAVPPLLSDGSGKIQYMFGYMSIINIGILVLSITKTWRWIYYTAYALSWLIFGVWTVNSFKAEQHFGFAFLYATIFFLTFYATFIAYKLIRKIPFIAGDIIVLISNSFIYFGLGYYFLNDSAHEQYQGIFCIVNGVIHMAVMLLARKQNSADRLLLFLLLGMVFTFVTIAVPVQLDGNWITLVWLSEMVLLLFLSKKSDMPLFNYLSLTTLILGLGSLMLNWVNGYAFNYIAVNKYPLTVIQNKYFVTSIYSCICLAAAWLLARSDWSKNVKNQGFVNVFKFVTFFSFIGVLYITCINEISYYFNQWYYVSEFQNKALNTSEVSNYFSSAIGDVSIKSFKHLWLLIFTVVFSVKIALVNLFVFKNQAVQRFTYFFNNALIVLFIAVGFVYIGELNAYVFGTRESAYVVVTPWFVKFRYLLMAVVGLLFGSLWLQRRASWSDLKVNLNNYSLIFITFVLGLIELSFYFNKWYYASEIKQSVVDKLAYANEFYNPKYYDESIVKFKYIWVCIFIAAYSAIISLINSFVFKKRYTQIITYVTNSISLLGLLGGGLFVSAALQRNLFSPIIQDGAMAPTSAWFVNIRYVVLALAALMLFVMYWQQRKEKDKTWRIYHFIFMHIIVLVMLSSELYHLYKMWHPTEMEKYARVARRMGFTILWSLYAMAMIVYGISKKNKTLRVMAMVIFGISILKLLFDSFEMSKGYKFVVWGSVGLILLCVAFLYNKFKEVLFGDDNDESKIEK